MKRKAEIIFEIEETITLRQSGHELQAFCPRCRALVEMIAPQIAAAICGLGEREIFRSIESGRLHYVEAERILICRNSLSNETEPLYLTGIS
jgi:hypothetical protein